jgi:hypothetical protein
MLDNTRQHLTKERGTLYTKGELKRPPGKKIRCCGCSNCIAFLDGDYLYIQCKQCKKQTIIRVAKA